MLVLSNRRSGGSFLSFHAGSLVGPLASKQLIFFFSDCRVIRYNGADVGRAQLEAQLPQPPQLQKLRCGLVLILNLMRFKGAALSIFFRIITQFYTLNINVFHFDCNLDKCRPFLANIHSFFV